MILFIDETGVGWKQREQVFFSDVNASVVFFTRYSNELKQLALKEICMKLSLDKISFA